MRLAARRALLIAALALLSLGSLSCRRARPDDTSAASTSPDGLRLSRQVRPKHYQLTLRFDPAQEPFSGEVAIRLALTERADALTLHARDLTITSAWLEGEGERVALDVTPPADDLLRLTPKSRLKPGDYTLKLAFEGKLGEEPSGLYRIQDKQDWYAVTQFEPLEARKAFPCFDEPSFKTPYDVTLITPSALVVAANASEKSSSPEANGLTRHVFHTTQPLPSYLVAFTAGPYEITELERDPQRDDPSIRLLAPKGRARLGQYALQKTPAILHALSDYFAQPYPFDKLDLVAVPDFAAGAMENVGLVTFRDTALLIDPQTATVGQRYGTQSIIAHELAHMWFGNLVTPAWWDDLWLNESFATWMASEVLESLDPTLESDLRQMRFVSDLMSEDSLSQTRAIRQPITSKGDVYNAFDGMTYGKGASLLRMLDAWVGHEAMRQGVRNYMAQNAYGTVDTPSLLAALDQTTGKPVTQVMRAFIDQPGVPLVELTPQCEGDGPATLSVSQSRYVPVGSNAPQTGPWLLPLCFSWSTPGLGEQSHCELIEGAKATITLPTPGCPDWIHPNTDELGYYHWVMPREAILSLANDHLNELSLRERIGLLGHLDALVDARRLDALTLYEVTYQMARTQEHGYVLGKVLSILDGVRAQATRSGLEQQLAALVRQMLRPHIARLGLEPQADEAPATAVLRAQLLGWMADAGQDPATLANAKSLLPQFFADPDAFPAHRQWALSAAAKQGDVLLWEQLSRVIDSAQTPQGRTLAVRALGNFRDPELQERSLDLFFDDRMRSNEFWALVGPGLGSDDASNTLVWSWFTRHYDRIIAKMDIAFGAPSLPYIGAAFCSPEQKRQVEAFFSDPAHVVEGTDRNLSLALESIDRCVAYREDVKQDVATFLERHTSQAATPAP